MASLREKALWATIVLAQGQANEAIVYFKTLLASPGRTAVWKTQLVHAYRAHGRVEDARQVINQIPDAREAIALHCRSRLMYYIDAGEAKFWCPMLESLEALRLTKHAYWGSTMPLLSSPKQQNGPLPELKISRDISAGCLHQFGQFRLKQQTVS